MIFNKKSHMKDRQMYVTVYEGTDTKDGYHMVDAELNANYVSKGEKYKSLHIFNRPFKDDNGNIDYMNTVPYSDKEIDAIKEAAGDNFVEVFDDDGKVIGKTYGVKASVKQSKINGISATKIDFNEPILEAKDNVTEDYVNDQVLYEENVKNDPTSGFSDKKSAKEYDEADLIKMREKAMKRHIMIYAASNIASRAFAAGKEGRRESEEIVQKLDNVIEFGG